jgi:hypothetical protein
MLTMLVARVVCVEAGAAANGRSLRASMGMAEGSASVIAAARVSNRIGGSCAKEDGD